MSARRSMTVVVEHFLDVLVVPAAICIKQKGTAHYEIVHGLGD